MSSGYYSQSSAGDTDPTFTLSPPPYRVILILSLVILLLGLSWRSSYEEVVETAELGFNWALLILPIILIFAIKWLSSAESPDFLFGIGPFDPSRRSRGYPYYGQQSSEPFPWGVAAVLVLLIGMVAFQNSFLDMWRP